MKVACQFVLVLLIGASFSSCHNQPDRQPSLAVMPVKGLPNSTILITGGNFSSNPADNYVEFAGGMQGVVDSATATTLFVTVPELAETGPIIVNTNNSDARRVEDFQVVTGIVTTFSRGIYVEHIALDQQGTLYGDSATENIIKISRRNGEASAFAGGSSSYNHEDGQGPNASFGKIWGLVADAEGNLFVNDQTRLRKVTPSGLVSTIAGSTYGSNDGLGAAAQFEFMIGITIDSEGSLYICDLTRIRKVTQAGAVSTIAGGPLWGYNDGYGTDATFFAPEGIVRDGSGNLFVSDTQNHNIRKITPEGLVTTFAGGRPGRAGHQDGVKSEAMFAYPQGMAIDAVGNIFLSDSDFDNGLYYIRLINAFGKVTTLLGGPAGTREGPLASARISAPDGIIFDPDGNLLFADTNNSTIRKITFQ